MTTGRDWFETESLDLDEGQEVNTRDIEGLVRNEVEGLSAGLDYNLGQHSHF